MISITFQIAMIGRSDTTNINYHFSTFRLVLQIYVREPVNKLFEKVGLTVACQMPMINTFDNPSSIIGFARLCRQCGRSLLVLNERITEQKVLKYIIYNRKIIAQNLRLMVITLVSLNVRLVISWKAVANGT